MHQRSGEFSTPADCAACRFSIRQGSQSFYLASLLLPAAVREPAYAVYAFCREADDRIDRDSGGCDAIIELGRMLDRIYAGKPAPRFVERGFADVVARYAIPREVPEALIEGLAWDAVGRRYRSFDDLLAYAVRVAGTVGIMMTLVMGRREPQVLARACDLGVAMQLTNIARDVGEDAANGRMYLPLAWLENEGADVERWLGSPRYDSAVRSCVDQLLDSAETLYARSQQGIAALPSGCRVGINAARLLYRAIGQEIIRGVDPVTTRAVTSRRRKIVVLTEAFSSHIAETSNPVVADMEQSDFLIRAVARAPAPKTAPPIPPWWDVSARSVRMIDLLNRFSVRTATVDSLRTDRPGFRSPT